MKNCNDALSDPVGYSGVRINKYIADSGVCSRREADRLITGGQVTLDDQPASLGSRVRPGQTVRINGEPILIDDDLVYLAINKPAGITSTTDERRSDNIIRLIHHEKRLFPVGRLDRDSEGLIFLTNDGSIVNKILRAGNRHEKEYLVTVDKPITEPFLAGMAGGVPILGTVTRPCRIRAEGVRSFRIILVQGMNRQIRRMCEYFGYEVLRLVRIRIMNVTLGNLRPGEWRNLTVREIAEIRRLISDSSPDPEFTSDNRR
ncbi:MAG TPA: 23S rRNA pseudouridine(2604) synthase RluF [Clostridiales bacterium]|nr:23S rRNA pseudouridine(2604) synthase RluF [Clostridiales bacterium]